MLPLTEKLVLLLLDEKMGKFMGAPSAIECAITGSMLLELALAGKLKLDRSFRVLLVDGQPAGNRLPDKALNLIAKSKKPQALLKWIINLTMQESRVIESFYFQQMAQEGLLKKETRPVLGIFKANRHFPTNAEIRKEILASLKKVIHLQKVTDPQAIYLLGLVYRCNLLQRLFDRQEINLYCKNSTQIFSPFFENRSSDDLANFYLTVLEAITFSQRSAGAI